MNPLVRLILVAALTFSEAVSTNSLDSPPQAVQSAFSFDLLLGASQPQEDKNSSNAVNERPESHNINAPAVKNVESQTQPLSTFVTIAVVLMPYAVIVYLCIVLYKQQQEQPQPVVVDNSYLTSW